MVNIEFLQSQSPSIVEDTADINALVRQLSSKPIENSPERVQKLVQASHCVVARDSESVPRPGRIIGMAFLSVKDSLSGQTGEVDDVVVDETYRGQGISRLLMESLIGRGRELGLKHLDLTSKPTRKVANILYVRVGFQLRETNPYRLELESE